jgi:hypothetical protein
LCAARLSKDMDKPLAEKVKERNAARNSKNLIRKVQKVRNVLDSGSSFARHERTRTGSCFNFSFQQGNGAVADLAMND